MDDLRRILVVEDEPDLREIIVSILSDNHSHVVGASNGQEGLDQLASDSFSLVLSDIKMPLVDGLGMGLLLISGVRVGLQGAHSAAIGIGTPLGGRAGASRARARSSSRAAAAAVPGGGQDGQVPHLPRAAARAHAAPVRSLVLP